MQEPLNRKFNVAVLHIASKLYPKGFDVGPKAPGTLHELNDQVMSTGRMLVWDGASDKTIFADPEVNYAFRAWHDFHHYRSQLGFDLAGEAAVAELQKRDIFKVYGATAEAREFARLIDAEVVAQTAFADHTGSFPADQRAFVVEFLQTQSEAGKALS